MNDFMPVTGDSTYCNPVPFSDGKIHTNPDPFVLRWCGRYYCYSSDEHGAKVSVSENLVHWEYRGYAIREQGYHHYWAPSVIYLNGTFYMYYSNIPIEEADCHEQHLKVAKAENPLGPFEWEKTFFDHFSIDSHPVIWGGKMYMFYSVNDWLGTEDKVAGTCILLDEMRGPYQFSGHPRPVVVPSIRKEIFEENRFGDGRDWYTIEGACTVSHNGKMWLLYSANAYEHEDYFVGTSVADEKAMFHEMEWHKYPDPYTFCPLLKRNGQVEGTGHNTVAKAPNLVDEWIVYHGRNAADELVLGTEQRNMRIDPLYFNGRHMMCSGPSMWEKSSPLLPHIMVREQEVKETFWAGESPLVYRMECWIKAGRSHCGARYGIYLDYLDERNHVEARLHSGQGKLTLLECFDGAAAEIADWGLPVDFDYKVPHLLTVQRNFNSFDIWLDEQPALTAHTCCMGMEKADDASGSAGHALGRIGVVPYFTQVMISSMAVTEHARLEGRQLQKMTAFYGFSKGTADEEGLSFGTGKAVLAEKPWGEDHTEEFEFTVDGEQPSIQILRGDTVLGQTLIQTGCDRNRQFSLYRAVFRDQEWMLLDGKPIPPLQIGGAAFTIQIQGIRITRYSYTKI